MGSVDRSNDQIFKVNFTDEGVAVLKERLNEKLKEFLGDDSDEILVEYVIVLLRNGKGKEQAKKDLDVFLGDGSDSFVTWLWDHLALNIDLYVQPKELQDVEAPVKIKRSEVEAGGDGVQHLNSKLERVKSSKLSRSRRNKDWKGLVGRVAEPPPLQSFVVTNTHSEEKAQSKVYRVPKSLSPASPIQKKRGRAVEQQKTKRDSVSQVTIGASRRLLQFAVRDAVATSRQSSLGTPGDPSLKRLRSVVSKSSAEPSLVEHTPRMQTISRMANPMATVIKAVTEAAEDAVKFNSSGNVYDRIGYDMNLPDCYSQFEDNYQHQEQSQLLYRKQNDYGDRYSMTMFEHETDFPTDFSSDNEGFDDVNVMGHRLSRGSLLGSPGGKRGEDSMMLDYSVAKSDDDIMHLKRSRVLEQSAAALDTSKIVNISVNVNTWNPKVPAQYQEPRKVAKLSGHQTLNSKIGAPRSGLRMTSVNAKAVKIDDGNVKPTLNLQKEAQKAQPSTFSASTAGCLVDADSRTIFASNVHFAATKDALCRHFNKFGEVSKVVIVTDEMTGQPKGAAYVEFTHKEAADNALSLDGTSFMSRILKVVRKSAAQQENVPAVPWPHGVRGSPYPSARFSSVLVPRGITGAFRPRPPIKLGARSLQWKRDAQGTSPDKAATLNNNSNFAPAARGFTYVRTESKLDGSSSTTT